MSVSLAVAGAVPAAAAVAVPAAGAAPAGVVALLKGSLSLLGSRADTCQTGRHS